MELESLISPSQLMWLSGHRINGTVTVPAAVFCEQAWVMTTMCGSEWYVEELTFLSPLTFARNDEVRSLIVELKDGSNARKLIIRSKTTDDILAQGTLGKKASLFSEPEGNIKALLPAGTDNEDIDVVEFYRGLEARGLNLNRFYHCISQLRYGDGRCLARIELPDDVSVAGYGLHPLLLDGAFQVMAAAIRESKLDADTLFLPFIISGYHLLRTGERVLWCHAEWRQSQEADNAIVSGSITLANEQGEMVAVIEQIQYRNIHGSHDHDVSALGQVCWVDKPLPNAPLQPLRRCMVISDDSPLCQQLHRQMTSLGGHCQRFDVDLEEGDLQPEDIDAVVYIAPGLTGSVNGKIMVEHNHETISALLQVIRVLASSMVKYPPLWVVTAGVHSSRKEADLANAPLTGISSCLNRELPDFRCLQLDLDPQHDHSRQAGIILAEVSRIIGEMSFDSPVSWLADRRRCRLIQPLSKQPSGSLPDGIFFVTGGTAGLGLVICEWLIASGARYIVLIARSEPSEKVRSIIENARKRGVTVKVEACDVAAYEDLKRVFQRTVEATGLAVAGIIHAAGQLRDGMLLNQTTDNFDQVLSPKLAGTWNLHQISLATKPSLFIMISSMASVLGSEGQSPHSAACSFLDAISYYRKNMGLPAVTINFGLVVDTRTSPLSDEKLHRRLEKKKLSLVSQEQAMAAMAFAIGCHDQSSPCQISVGTRPGQASAIATVSDNNQGDRGTEASSLLRTITGLVGEVLERAPETIRTDTELQRYGMDSLLAVEIRNRLTQHFEWQLPATLLFDYVSIDQLVMFIEKEIGSVNQETSLNDNDAVETDIIKPQENVDDDGLIGIIGMACRFPGVNSPEEFWHMLEQEGHNISEIPPDRWGGDDLYEPSPSDKGKISTRFGGFINNIADFDADFFGILPHEARRMDPQHRILLEVCWEALERAGYTRAMLDGSNTGVFIGLMYDDYLQLQSRRPDLQDGNITTGNGAGLAAGRISYTFNLKGPSLSVNTACSSSGVALDIACAKLNNEECDLAIVAGCSLNILPTIYTEFSQLDCISVDGKCRAMSDDANGIVCSEGCGAIVIKRLANARRDGESPIAVIHGVAVNQDGYTQGFSAPNGEAQVAVIQQALQKARRQPADLDYLEVHGIGTPLGDAVEGNALCRLFERSSKSVGIGSVKSNIGHTQAASCIAAIMKVALSLQRKTLPASLFVTTPNHKVNWDTAPLRILKVREKWEVTPRLAGINCFSFSGSNCHIVMGDCPDSRSNLPGNTVVLPDNMSYLLPVSARTDSALKRRVNDLFAFMTEHADISLNDISFTLCLHRDHYPARALFSLSPSHSPGEVLAAFREGSAHQAILTLSGGQHHWSPLIFQYLQGKQVDWQEYCDGRSYRKVVLPVYPFERKHYWINDPPHTEQATLMMENKAHAIEQPGSSFIENIRRSPKEQQLKMVQESLKELAADILNVPVSEIPRDRPLQSIGLTSLTAVAMRNRISDLLK